MIMRFLRTIAGIAFLAACGSDQATEPEQTPPVTETPTISLTVLPDTVGLEVGDSVRLRVTVTNTIDVRVSFRSSNTNVALVSTDGVVTAVGVGNALITAASMAASAATDATIVSVRAPAPPAGTAPQPLRTLGLGRIRDRYTAEVAVAGDYAYTTTCCLQVLRGNAINVWDITRVTPELINTVIVGEMYFVGDVQISDDGKLLAVATESGPAGGRGAFFYDRTDPKNLVRVGHWEPGEQGRSGVHTLKLSRINGRLYGFMNANEVYILDLTDPANPKQVARMDIGGPIVHDVFVRDGILFTAEWNDGMGIYDVGGGDRGGSPSNPVKISSVKTVGGSVHNIWWFHDPRTDSKKWVFVGEEGPGVYPTRTTGDVHVVDISDIAKPREVAFFHVDPGTSSNAEPAGAHNFSMDEASGILYAAFYNGGVRALDARGDLSDCTTRQKSSDGRCDLRLMGREVGRGLVGEGTVGIWGVVYSRARVYASDMLSGLYVIDASVLQR